MLAAALPFHPPGAYIHEGALYCGTLCGIDGVESEKQESAACAMTCAVACILIGAANGHQIGGIVIL